MPNKNSIFILLLLVNLHCWSQFRTEKVFLVHDGYNRSYEFYIPRNFQQIQSYPVVFILHGGGGTARGIIRNTRARFNQLADRDGFVAVYPNGIGRSWNDGARDTLAKARKLEIDDVGFIQKVIDDLDEKINIERQNIFACGISNGGFMAQRLALELSDQIRGIGVVAANLSNALFEKEPPTNPVPVIFINGTADPIVPYNGRSVAVFRQKRGEVLSVPESISFWQKVNGCSQKVTETIFPDKNKKDGCTATRTVFQNPDNPKLKVVAIKVKKGGHSWPGSRHHLPKRLVGNTNQDFNGCDEIWIFFKALTPQMK